VVVLDSIVGAVMVSGKPEVMAPPLLLKTGARRKFVSMKTTRSASHFFKKVTSPGRCQGTYWCSRWRQWCPTEERAGEADLFPRLRLGQLVGQAVHHGEDVVRGEHAAAQVGPAVNPLLPEVGIGEELLPPADASSDGLPK